MFTIYFLITFNRDIGAQSCVSLPKPLPTGSWLSEPGTHNIEDQPQMDYLLNFSCPYLGHDLCLYSFHKEFQTPTGEIRDLLLNNMSAETLVQTALFKAR